jgi:hypothetical protein
MASVNSIVPMDVELTISQNVRKNFRNMKHYFNKLNRYDAIKNQIDLLHLIPDESTNEYINSFLNTHEGGNIMIKKLVIYLYQEINCSILEAVNRNIYTQFNNSVDLIPLFYPKKHDEQVALFFKGGSNMYFIYTYISQILRQSQGSSELQELLQYLDTTIGSKFKLSDTDMNLHIETYSLRRYNIIYYAVYNTIVNKMENICETLEILYKSNSPNYYNIDQLQLQSLLGYYIHNDKYGFANILAFIEFINNNKRTLDLSQNIQYIIEHFITPRRIDHNCQYNSYLIEYIDYILYTCELNRKNIPIIETDNATDENILQLKKYREHLLIFINYDLNHIRRELIGLYTDDKKEIFHEALYRYVYNIKTDVDQNKRLNNSSTLTINGADFLEKFNFFKVPEKNDIVFGVGGFNGTDTLKDSRRNNTYIYDIHNSVNPIRVINDNANTLHFITVNNSISNYIKHVRLMSFSLLRIKFNVLLKNCLINKNYNDFDIHDYPEGQLDQTAINSINTANQTIIGAEQMVQTNINVNRKILKEYKIPAEILDITITDYHDNESSPYYHLMTHSKDMVIRMFDRYDIICHGYLYIYLDLKDTLFKSQFYTPWINNKYEKRIVRLYFFMVLSHIYELSIPYQNIRNLLTNISNMSRIILEHINNNTTNATRLTELLAFFCNNPHNLNVEYCQTKLPTSIKLSNLVDIKNDFITCEDIIDSIIVNFIYYNNDNALTQLMTRFCDLYNFTPPTTDIYRRDYIEYLQKNIDIINIIIPIFDNLVTHNLLPQQYEQAIPATGGGFSKTKKYHRNHNTKTKSRKY